MSKMKVYELAKELGKSSKELLEFLGGKNIEVKSHMSSIENETIEMVRKAFGGKTGEPKAETAAAAKTEAAPKKKNIVHVFRPQNSRDGARGTNRQGGRQMGGKGSVSGGRPMQNAKPMQVQNGRPLPGSKPIQNAKPMQVQNGRPAPGAKQAPVKKAETVVEQP